MMKSILKRIGTIGCAAGLLGVAEALAAPQTNQVLTITSPWRYTTNNVDAEAWTDRNYTDTSWAGPGNALLYIETAALPAPKTTPLPPAPNGLPFRCYYFRTSFNLASTNDVARLVLTDLIDDGAVFYLNGTEIQRVRMNAGTVTYATQAGTTVGDATSFDTFVITGAALTNLVVGGNVLAARVHQSGTSSSDIVFGAALAVVTDANPQALVVRGPYLQSCSSSNLVVRWRTDMPSGSRVVYGTDLSSINMTNETPGDVTEHEVLLTGLLPDTRYYYGIGSGTNVAAGLDSDHWFVTHPQPGSPKPLHIWVTGDAGTKNANQRAVRDAFYKLNGTNVVHAWLQLGDNAYSSGTDAEHQLALFEMYPTLLRNTVTWPALGNHETYSTDPNGRYAFLNIFTLPTNAVAGGVPSGTELYYSFDVGMVHFVCLDSMTSSRSPTGAMANWLRADLEATTNRWVIAYFHHPPYSKGSHNSDTESELVQMRQALLPILEAGGVDLVLCGHSHSYERSYLLNGHYGVSTTLTPAMKIDAGNGRENGTGAYVKPENASGTPIGNRGAVYAVAGSSGQTSGGSLNHPAMFISLNLLGSMVLDITTNRLDAIFLRETVTPLITNDWFTIIKTNFAPAASNLTVSVAGDATTPLQLQGNDVNRNPITFSAATLPAGGLLSDLDPNTGTVNYTPAHGSTNGDSFSFTTNDGQLDGTPGVVTIQVIPPVDGNQNGMPDTWETTYGIADPEGDDDGDGALNRSEYWAGTNPTNALSWLRVTEINQGQAGFQVTWSSVGGTRYRVLFSDGDDQGGYNGVFTPIARPVTTEMDASPIGMPSTMAFTDDLTLTGGTPTHGSRYFRVEVVR